MINSAANCHRGTSNAICWEYGFRHPRTYHPRQTSPRSLQLKLSIDNEETIYYSEWELGTSVHLLTQPNAPNKRMAVLVKNAVGRQTRPGERDFVADQG
jgi:hypothetical protein